MLASEVNPQIKALRDNDIEVTPIIAHMGTLIVEQPNNDAAKSGPGRNLRDESAHILLS